VGWNKNSGAAGNGDIEMLKWCITFTKGCCVDGRATEATAESRHLHMLKWLVVKMHHRRRYYSSYSNLWRPANPKIVEKEQIPKGDERATRNAALNSHFWKHLSG
jgi:hypothetical protein